MIKVLRVLLLGILMCSMSVFAIDDTVKAASDKTTTATKVAAAKRATAGNAKNKPAYTISKSSYRIAPEAPIDTVEITNNLDKVVTLQLKPNTSVKNAKGIDVLTSTRDINVIPPIVRLEPKQSQTVRIGTTKPFGEQETRYTLEVTDITPIPKFSANNKTEGPRFGVTIKFRYLLRILVAPMEYKPQAELTVKRVNQKLQATLKNTGNFTARISRIVFADPKTDQQITTASQAADVKMNESHTWSIKSQKAIPEQVRATVYMEHGPIVLTASV